MSHPPPLPLNRDHLVTIPGSSTPRTGRRHTRCRVAMSLSGGSAFQGAIESLLHQRLLFVAVLTLVPLSVFFVLNQLDTNLPPLLTWCRLAFHGGVTVAMALMAWVLWRRPHLSLKVLRVIELAVFGSLAVFFAWMQYSDFVHGPLAEASTCAQGPLILRQAVDSSTTKWFCLIVLYGVFIPNTWRRCLLVSLGLALTPLLLTPLAASHDGPLQPEMRFA